MDDDENTKQHQTILERLDQEEKDHKMIVARLESIETSMEPLVNVAPYLADLAGTGRVGMAFGKFLVWMAGILAAIAGIWYTAVHGFQK